MTVELVCVGTEILLGNIVNTNAAYLAEQCARLGLSLYYQTAVGDNPDRLLELINLAMSRSDVVILCGGLGPTQDDLTKEIAAKAAGKELIEDAHTKERIQEFFKRSQYKVITENNWKQALVPEGAIVVDNDNGTAPGIIIETEKNKLILLPGPPNELIPMFEKDIFPYLNQLQPEIIYSQMVKVCGIGESMAETMISDLIETQSNPTIATYAKTGEVHLRVTAKAESEKEAKKLTKPMVRELKKRFGYNIYSTNEKETLEEVVVTLLKDLNLTLSTAESCTGGLISSRIVNVPGASEVFKQGFVTYSNKAKQKTLGVSKATLKKYGAVSEKTVKEMAKGAAAAAGTDISIAVTGIAGPDGGTKEKPVGLVYLGCYVKGKVTVKEFIFKGNRDKIRDYSAVNALILLRSCVLEHYKE